MQQRAWAVFFLSVACVATTVACDYDNGSGDADAATNSNQNNTNSNQNNTNSNQNNTNSNQSNTNVNQNTNQNTNPASCDFVPDPSNATGEPGVMAGMTEQHNYWRFRVGVAMASWNEGIAAHAQAYVDTCPSGHSSSSDRQNVAGFSYLGENIYYHSSSSADPVAAVDSWASERSDYDYGTPTGGTGAMVGHYTQIVWESSTAIGCGVARCSGGWGTIVVCQYGPGGNYTGQTPYDWVENDCVDLDNDDVLQRDDSDDTDRTVH